MEKHQIILIKNIDYLIERTVNIGVEASEKITFNDVKNASKFFRDLIEREIIIKYKYSIGTKKAVFLTDYLKEIEILGYTASKAGIYDELSIEEITGLIKRNKPINIIAFSFENTKLKDNGSSLNVA